jgi:hypothetical protein
MKGRVGACVKGTMIFSTVKWNARMNGQAKRIGFRYNDDQNTEVEVDILGDLPDYLVGDMVVRKGKSWKVVKVLIEEAIVGSRTLPVYNVTLTDKV